jgi:hypothetical protein
MRINRAVLITKAGVGALVVTGAMALGGTAAFAYGPTPPSDGGSGSAATVPAQQPAATPVSTSSGLAFTGADVAITTAAGAAAIGLGGGLVLASRRRRHQVSPAA